MDTKILFYIVLLIVMVLSVLVLFQSEEKSVEILDLSFLNNKKVVSEFTDYKFLTRNNLVDFISQTSGFTFAESEFLVKECNNKDLNVFLVLGLIRLESNFDKYLVGTSGERGLGQVMLNTGKQLAKNLELEYHPDKLFDSKYNIKLFTTHLKYLEEYYKGDIHKTLTAYNRGQRGLRNYMASRGSTKHPERSAYSNRVLHYYDKYKTEYETENEVVNAGKDTKLLLTYK